MLSPGFIFAITYAIAFTLLAGAVAGVRLLLKRRRQRAFQQLLRARSTLYAQMNALVGEFHRIAKMEPAERIEAVGPDPLASSAGVLFSDVTDHLAIAAMEVQTARTPKALEPASVALHQAIQVLLDGLRGALDARSPEGFVRALPKAAPTVNAEPIKQADRELRAFAEAEGLAQEEFFYQDASFYV